MSSKSYKDLSPSRRFENARLQDLLPIKNAILDLFSKLAKNPFDVPNVLNQLSTSEYFQNFTDEISKRFFKSCFLKHDELYKKNFFSKAHRIFNSLSSDNHLIDFIGNKIKEKSELFKTIPADLASYIIPYINAWSLQGKTSAIIFPDLKNQISQLLDWQIRRIARTEVSKSLTDITEFKCSQGNIKIYQWKASGGGRGDGRTRFSHRKMADILIFWDDPPAPEDLFPIIGKNGKKYKNTLGHYHAGCCPNCRCVAMPVVSISDIEFPARIYYGGSIHRINKFDFLKLYGNIETKKQEPEKTEKTLTPEDLEELFNEDPFDNESLQELYEEELEKQKKAEEEAKQKAEEERLLELIDPDEFEHLGEFFSEESLEGLFEEELEKQKAEEEAKKKAEEEAKKKAEEAKKKAEEAKKKAEEEAKKKAEEEAKKKAEEEAKKKAEEEAKKDILNSEEEFLRLEGIQEEDLPKIIKARKKINNDFKQILELHEKYKDTGDREAKIKRNIATNELIKNYSSIRTSKQVENLNEVAGKISDFNRFIIWRTNQYGYIQTPNSFKLNSALRNDDLESLEEENIQTINVLKKVISNNYTNKNIVLYRHVDYDKLEFFKATFGFDFNVFNKQEMQEAVDKVNEDFRFCEITDKGFVSTSYNLNNNLFHQRYVRLELLIPAGSHVFLTGNALESEIILPPESKFILLRSQVIKDKEHPQVLLQLQLIQ